MRLEAPQEFFHPRPPGVSSSFRALCRAAKAYRESFVDPKFGRPGTEAHQQMAGILVLNILYPVRKAMRAKTRFDVVRHARTRRQCVRSGGDEKHGSMNALDFD